MFTRWRRRRGSAGSVGEATTSGERLIESLTQRVHSPGRAASVLTRAAAFSGLSAAARDEELPALYLLFEHCLAESELAPLSRSELRRDVRRDFPELLETDSFRLILARDAKQEILLCRHMLRRVLSHARDVLGATGGQSIAEIITWVDAVPDATDEAPVPGIEPATDPGRAAWVTRLGRVAAALHRHLQSVLGERNATALFDAAYQDTFDAFSGLETFPVVIGLLPDRLLDEQKIVLLSRHQVQRVALVQVEKLESANVRLSQQNQELERVRRELQAAKRQLEQRVVEREVSLQSATVERRRAEAELDRVREQQEALLHSIPDPAWLKDSEQRFLAVNEATVRMLNADRSTREDVLPLTRESLIGARLTELLVPAAATRTAAEDTLVLEDERTLRFEVAIEPREGGTRWLDRVVMPVRDRNGATVGIVGVAHDVTERKQLEMKLLQSQKMEAVGRLAGGIAHDFNNLLTAIRGHAEFLLEDLEPGSEQRLDAEGVVQGVDRASSLTRQLLAFSRKQVLQPRVVDPNAVVTDMERMLRRLIGEDIELATRMAPEAGRIRADPAQIEQVILNLAVNARDAMPEGGSLVIETNNVELDPEYGPGHPEVSPGNYVLIAVTDTGCGMDEATRAQIFEPFFTTKGVGKGTGLGLSTAYGIVQQSGGFIWAYSEVGKGTTFKIYLPRVDAAADAPVDEQRAAPRGGAETILLVEDDFAVRALARRLLLRNSYHVLEATDGLDALRIAGEYEGTIHLLLTDAVMPKLGGRELAERLLQSRPDLAVICMSGYTDDAVLRHGMIKEGACFVEKPFTPDGLLRKVRSVLDAPTVTALQPQSTNGA